MRKLIFILLLATSGQAQMTGIVIGPYAGFGRITAEINATNNIRIPFLYYIPASAAAYLPGGAKAGQKPPHLYMFVCDLHGCGEKSTTFSNYAAITTAELSKMYNNGMSQYLRYSTSDYVDKKFAASGRTDSFEVIYAFPQSFGGVTSNACAGNTGLGLFEPAYPYYVGKWMLSTFGNLIDRKHCYLTGLSFGAGGVLISFQMPQIQDIYGGGISAAPGYADLRNIDGGNTQQGNGSNWNALDSFPGFIMLVHSTDDDQTDKQPGTSIGSWYSDVARDSLLNRKGAGNYLLIRKTDGKHAGSWTSWQARSNSTVSYPMSNGQSWKFSIPWQSLLLGYSLQSRQHP